MRINLNKDSLKIDQFEDRSNNNVNMRIDLTTVYCEDRSNNIVSVRIDLTSEIV